MDIISEIGNLKEKISNEIESLRYYKELSYTCNALQNEVNSYEYDINDNYSLKKYKAFLESFLENRIGYVNSLIVNKNNNSIFDNGSEADYGELNNLKNNISELLSYIENNFPIIGKEVAEEFDEINKYYEKEFVNASNYYKKIFDREIGINKGTSFSIYCDTSSVLKSYVNKLAAFKKVRVDNIKIFVDNDIKVKELFKRAYETLKEPRVIEAVRKLESNYINEISKCVESLSANTNILLIQNNMIQNGLQLDKIIDMEKEKNDIYSKISNITFNYNDINELLKIEEYVINNNYFYDEFYKVLYALVEKEKYIYLKYKKEPVIYNIISEKSKIILEKLFLENIKNIDDSQKEKIIINLKKNGYFKVLDSSYQEFFDNLNFQLETSYYAEEVVDDWILDRKYIEKGLLEPHYDIINRETKKRVDRFFNIPKYVDEFTRVGDIYIYSRGKKESGSLPITKYQYHYYDKDGKKIKPFKDNSLITEKIFDYYLVNKESNRLLHKNKMIVNSNFNKIMDYNGENFHKEILVDYKNKQILMLDTINNIFSLYDKDFKLIKEIPVSKIVDFINEYTIVSFNDINMFNDGIVSFLIKDSNENYICYYDVLNMRKVDMFKVKYFSSLYGYSEGLYPYFDADKYLLGYKNLDGKIVLEPKFLQAHPFVNGCALVVRELSVDHGFINIRGEYEAKAAFLGYDQVNIKFIPSKYQYRVLYIHDNKRAIIRINNIYSTDCDDKIINVDISDKTKVKKIK